MSKPADLARKLHRLVVSPNANEATAAAQKLSDLVRVHGLRLSDLDTAHEAQRVVYRDRVVEVPVYRDWVVYASPAPPPTTTVPLHVHPTRHHKVDDDGYCMQKCSCGEWFTDSNFYRHMNTTFYAERRNTNEQSRELE